MKSKINDRKIKLLLHKLGYLRLEIEEKSEELSRHEEEFNEKYYSNFKEEEEEPAPQSSTSSSDPEVVEIPVPEESVQENTEENTDNSVEQVEPLSETKEPEDMKKIWKQIAMSTHPDKTGSDPKLTDLYKKASEAYKEKRYDEIIEIAITLGLNLENLSEETAKLLEKRVEELEKKLQGLQLNVLWEWARGDDAKKKKIEKVLHSYRKKKKRKK